MIRIVNVKMGKQLHCKVEQGKCLTAKRIQDQPILRGRPLAGGPCHSLDVNTLMIAHHQHHHHLAMVNVLRLNTIQKTLK